MLEKSSTLASQTQNDTTMVVTPTKDQGATAMPFNSSNTDREFRSVEEFMDDLAKRLGKHYGLNDIREAWKMK